MSPHPSQFYENGILPFTEIVRKIEAEEEPYIPPYSEDGEPPFLAEWMGANSSKEIVGMTCLSMLSESLKLYLMTWESELRVDCQKEFKAVFKKRGFLAGYKAAFGKYLGIDWSECPVDFHILEEVIHVRNSSQHPKNIFNINIVHPHARGTGQSSPIFIDKSEKKKLANREEDFFWLTLHIKVTPKSLISAIEQVDIFANWLDGKMFDFIYSRT